MKKLSYLLICSSIFQFISCNKKEEYCDPIESYQCSSEFCDKYTCVSEFYPFKREEYKIGSIYHILDNNGKIDSTDYSYKRSSKDYSNEEEYSLLYSNLFDLIDFFISKDSYDDDADQYNEGLLYTTLYSLYSTVSDGNYRRTFNFGFSGRTLTFNFNTSTYITKGSESFLYPLVFDLTDEQKEKMALIKELTVSLLKDELEINRSTKSK